MTLIALSAVVSGIRRTDGAMAMTKSLTVCLVQENFQTVPTLEGTELSLKHLATEDVVVVES